MNRSDIPSLIDAIAAWHPDISVGIGSCYLRESFYTEKVFLRDEVERDFYELLGFVPGYDREVVAPGVVKRVYEAVYAKVLVVDEELQRPDPKNLSPKARALFGVLFPA